MKKHMKIMLLPLFICTVSVLYCVQEEVFDLEERFSDERIEQVHNDLMCASSKAEDDFEKIKLIFLSECEGRPNIHDEEINYRAVSIFRDNFFSDVFYLKRVTLLLSEISGFSEGTIEEEDDKISLFIERNAEKEYKISQAIILNEKFAFYNIINSELKYCYNKVGVYSKYNACDCLNVGHEAKLLFDKYIDNASKVANKKWKVASLPLIFNFTPLRELFLRYARK